jgi:hypothetical protein
MFAALLGLLLAALCCQGAAARAAQARTGGKTPFQAYQELSVDLEQAYPEAICNHNLQVVLALDVSGSMKNRHSAEFGIIWDSLVRNFFQPGDSFMLLPWSTRVFTAERRDFDAARVDDLSSWLQKPGGDAAEKGSLLHLAQAEALREAKRLAKQDPTRPVLVLVVTDTSEINWQTEAQRKLNERNRKEIPGLLKALGVSTGEMSRKPYALEGLERPLEVFYTLGMPQGAPQAREPPARQIDRGAPPTTGAPRQEADPRGWYWLFGLLALGAAGLSLTRTRFKVELGVGKAGVIGTTYKVLPARQPVTVEACNTVDQPEDHQLWLPVHGSDETPKPLVEIDGRSPQGCVIRKTGGYLELADGRTPNEFSIDYGDRTTLRVGLAPNGLENLDVHPALWADGKTVPIILCAALTCVGLVLIIMALGWQPTPASAPVIASGMEPLCGGSF